MRETIPALVMIVAIALTGCGAASPSATSSTPTTALASPTPAAGVTSPSATAGGFNTQSARGIFALSTNQGFAYDSKALANDFVTGYTYRKGWYDFEPSKDNYDFSALDSTLSQLNAMGKKMSLDMLSTDKTEASYVADQPGVTTWVYTDQNPRAPGYGQPVKKPVPWDPFVQSRFALFMQQLANHQTPSPSGGTVAFRDNPALVQLVVIIPGLGSIREGPGAAATPELTILPGYTRDGFIQAILATLRAAVDNFPGKAISIPFFQVTDNTSTPPLMDAISDAIQSEFDGVKNPKVGYFAENLAAHNSGSGVVCSPDGSREPLSLAKGKTWVALQMLEPWTHPSNGSSVPFNAAAIQGTIPTDAIDCANRLMGTTYFEVYVADLLNPDWASSFRVESARLLAMGT